MSRRYGREERDESVSYLAGVVAGADTVAAHVVARAVPHEARSRLGSGGE